MKELLTNVMKQWLGRFGIHIPEDSVVDFFINTDNGDLTLDVRNEDGSHTDYSCDYLDDSRIGIFRIGGMD